MALINQIRDEFDKWINVSFNTYFFKCIHVNIVMRYENYEKVKHHKIHNGVIKHLVKHSSSPGVPLGKYVNDDVYKALFLDIGLSNNMNKIQLTDPLQICTLHPAHIEPALYFWSREEKNSNSEVDFYTSIKIIFTL